MCVCVFEHINTSLPFYVECSLGKCAFGAAAIRDSHECSTHKTIPSYALQTKNYPTTLGNLHPLMQSTCGGIDRGKILSILTRNHYQNVVLSSFHTRVELSVTTVFVMLMCSCRLQALTLCMRIYIMKKKNI